MEFGYPNRGHRCLVLYVVDTCCSWSHCNNELKITKYKQLRLETQPTSFHLIFQSLERKPDDSKVRAAYVAIMTLDP